MAGQQKKQRMIGELDRLTRREFPDDALATHLDFVTAYVAGGGTLTALAAEIGEALGETIHRPSLTKYLVSLYGPKAVAELEAARREGAHALVEQAMGIVDEAPADRDEIALAKLRAEFRERLAGRWNRAEYGEQKAGVNVAINLGTLHLDALRQRASARAELAPSSTPSIAAPAEDVEVLVSSE